MTSTAQSISTEPRSVMSLLCLVFAAIPWAESVSLIPALAAALFAWLARVAKGSRQYAPFSSVYAAAIVFLLPPFDLSSALFNRLEPFFITLALSYLLGMALDGIQDSTPWAWLAPLLLLIFMPNVLGLIATFGLALLAALEKQQRYIGLNPYHLESQTLLKLALVALMIAALGFLLPKPQVFHDPTGGAPISAAQPAQPKEQPKLGLEATSNQPIKIPDTKRLESSSNALFQAANALLFGVVIVLAAFLFNAKLEKRKKTGQNSLWDFMPIIGGMILAIAVLALALNAPNGGSNPNVSTSSSLSGGSSESGQAEQLQPEETAEQKPTQTSLWIPIILTAIGLFFAYLIWRSARKQFLITPELEPENKLFSNIPSQHATNRIRIAYQTFLEYAQTQGIPRHNAETPLEFAVRYSQINSSTQVASLTLTNLYEPVRYGNQAAETHAVAAEQALENIIHKP
ncbi:MAG: hypothetical protein RLZZ156_1812 [Deinococcota bacterium]